MPRYLGGFYKLERFRNAEFQYWCNVDDYIANKEPDGTIRAEDTLTREQARRKVMEEIVSRTTSQPQE